MTSGIATPQLVEHYFRHESGRLVALLTRRFGPEHLELAEDCVQDALAAALRNWPYRGVPTDPSAWLLRVARNRALDQLRQRRPEVAFTDDVAAPAGSMEDDGRALAFDDQLCLMLMCCHPLLGPEAHIALILKCLCGFGVEEIARALLLSRTAVAQRLVRAKRLLRVHRPSFALPPPPLLAARLDAVLAAVYALFSEGYRATQGEQLIRRELCAEALRLADLLVAQPELAQPHVHALRALMYLHAARLPSRTDDSGMLLLLDEQDRRCWDQAFIAQGMAALRQAQSGRTLSRYHLEAGIAACHAVAASVADTDWRAIQWYYDALVELTPTAVVMLNRAVARGLAGDPHQALADLQALDRQAGLDELPLYHAARADMHRRLGHRPEAMLWYASALARATNRAEQRFLQRQLARLSSDASE